MSYDKCYIYDPISSSRMAIFEKLVSRVPRNANIIDIGCGPIGHYWALGYADRVKKIGFVDRDSIIINELEQEISNLSPKVVEKDFESTLRFLEELDDGIVLNTSKLLEDLVTKCTHIQAADFLQDETIGSGWDCALAIESLECVESEFELRLATQNIYNSLDSSGLLLIYALRYDKQLRNVSPRNGQGTYGKLNPPHELLCSTLESVGFTIDFELEQKTKMSNYTSASFIAAKKSVLRV